MTARTPLLLALIPTILCAQTLPTPNHVALPLDEYNKLIEQANKAPKKPDGPPLTFAIQRADLKFQVSGETASGSIQLDGEVLSKGIVRVPLIHGVTILDAQQKGKDLPLEQQGGAQTAVLSGPGDFSITLNAGIPLGIDAGRASLALPSLPAGAVRLTLIIPGDHTNVNLNSGLITSRASSNGRTTIEATLAPGQPATVWWATRETTAPPPAREARFLADVKTLVSVGQIDLGVTALIDVTVVQGEPSQFEIEIPSGYELTTATGANLDSVDVRPGLLIIKVTRPAERSQQFLIAMEKQATETKAAVPFFSVKGAQRETGEILIDSEGTMELTAKESGSLKRMDLKETSPYLRSLSHNPQHAAFRYHRQPSEPPSLALEWVRFPDSKLLAAVAQQAIVTTLVTSEGKSLTEIKLILKNQAQPFLRVALPTGASILSAEVAGEKVKPVQGPDGSRVPLLRPGFRPAGSYTVSFVFMHSGAPFAKKGGSELALPKMDLPIGLVQWEVFLPQQFKVKDFGGDAIAAHLLPVGAGAGESLDETVVADAPVSLGRITRLAAGQMGGMIVDPSGAVVPNVRLTITHLETGATMTAVTDLGGSWIISNVPSGHLKITADSPGFRRLERTIDYNAGSPLPYHFALQVGAATESVEVTSTKDTRAESQRIERDAVKRNAPVQEGASANVVNLQRRVSGVLPIPIDIPRAGASFKFARPLVVDEETKLTFTYNTK